MAAPAAAFVRARPEDFTLSANRTLRFAAGATESGGTVTITAMDDTVVEPDKQVMVSGTVDGASMAAPADAMLMITDDDEPAWVVTADPPAIAEPGGAATVTVSTGGVTFMDPQAITLSFTGTATPGSDYLVADARGDALASPYELTLAVGASEVTATITALDDHVDEEAETIAVTARYQGAVIGEQPTVTIIDDDAPPL